MLLKDKIVVVTGSGNGIGAAFARRFTAEGAKVVVTDIEPDACAAMAKEVGGVGLAGDITQEATVQAVAELARKTYGRIDLWFSNAGHSGLRQPGELQDDSQWDLAWRLHVMSHVYAARAVLPEMTARGDGYLLNTASSVALSLQVEKAAYTVTKHGALSLSEWLSLHYRPKGVRVSCFCPGPMMTRMLRSNGLPEDHPVMQMALTPEQVAEVLVRGIEKEDFLILFPNSGLLEGLKEKAGDYDAWIARHAPAVS